MGMACALRNAQQRHHMKDALQIACLHSYQESPCAVQASARHTDMLAMHLI